MMAKPLATIFALTLIGNLRAEDPAPATSIITWRGSAFKDGDAFNVTATIREKEVQLIWDGFASPEFDFMDDRENPKVRRGYIFKDEPTVKAFRIIADQAEQCDAGYPMVIGQGVSTEVEVESPPGRTRRHLRYFGTTVEKLKVGKLEEIPWDLKKALVDSKVEEEVHPDSKFSQGLRIFADQLDAYRIAFGALSKACENGAELPMTELEKVLSPLSLENCQRIYGSSVREPEAIRKSLPLFQSILAACFTPSNRALLCGEGKGSAGSLLNIGVCRSEQGVSFPILKMDVEVPDYRVRMFSYEEEAFLLHFILGRRSWEFWDACNAFHLVPSHEGKLQIQKSERYSESEDSTPDSPEINRRLEYLNERNICGVLLGLPDTQPGKDIAMVQIFAIGINGKNPDQAKVDFLLDGKEKVLEVSRAHGEWKPGKLWNKQDYYLIDGVFHNDAGFRPEGR